MVCPDPRAFAVYKQWLSEQRDRDPGKIQRDRQQAAATIAQVREKFPHLALDDNAERLFPATVRKLFRGSEFGLRGNQGTCKNSELTRPDSSVLVMHKISAMLQSWPPKTKRSPHPLHSSRPSRISASRRNRESEQPCRYGEYRRVAYRQAPHCGPLPQPAANRSRMTNCAAGDCRNLAPLRLSCCWRSLVSELCCA